MRCNCIQFFLEHYALWIISLPLPRFATAVNLFLLFIFLVGLSLTFEILILIKTAKIVWLSSLSSEHRICPCLPPKSILLEVHFRVTCVTSYIWNKKKCKCQSTRPTAQAIYLKKDGEIGSAFNAIALAISMLKNKPSGKITQFRLQDGMVYDTQSPHKLKNLIGWALNFEATSLMPNRSIEQGCNPCPFNKLFSSPYLLTCPYFEMNRCYLKKHGMSLWVVQFMRIKT